MYLQWLLMDMVKVLRFQRLWYFLKFGTVGAVEMKWLSCEVLFPAEDSRERLPSSHARQLATIWISRGDNSLLWPP